MSKDSWSPRQYDKFKDERSQPFFDLMDLIRGDSFAKAIDLGCGTGQLTAILHERTRARETLGIDNSANMLAQAKSISAAGLSFREAEIGTLGTLGKFDLVFSNAALQWCSKHEELFQKIRDSLSPAGQIAIQMPMNHDYPTHLIATQLAREEPFRTWLNDAGGERKPNVLLPEDYAALLFRLGFKEQRALLKVYGHVLDSREGVIEWVKGTLLTYFQSRLSPEQYVNFLTVFRERLFEKLGDDRPFFYPFKRVLLWGCL